MTAAASSATRDLEQALRRSVRGEVRFDDQTRWLFSRDASMYAIEPLGVVFPRDADDVAATVATAGEAGVAVLPRGAGTSLAGQTVGRAVVMDFSRHMDQIIDLDPERRSARVQPGVVQEQLNAAARQHGLVFGPDTSTSDRATLGGMIGNNSAGSHSIRYGMTIDHVRSLDVVLSDASRAVFAPLAESQRAARAVADTLDGRIHRELPALLLRHRDAIATGYPRFWRQSGGYRLDRLAAAPEFDLARFVVGSEGTLVTVTEATVGLEPAPRHQVIAVGHFRSAQSAIEATGDALACDPAAVELMDRTILDLARAKLEYAELTSLLTGDPDALLFVTFFGETAAQAAAGADSLQRLWARHGHGYHVLHARTPAEREAVLRVRRAGLGLLMSASRGAHRPLAFVEDTAVDPAVLPAYAARFREILASHGLHAGFYGHCSVGCLHIRPFVDVRDPRQRRAMREVAGEVAALVASFGGVNSSEHGDGLARSQFNQSLFGEPLYQAMREVKNLFDPHGRMNPGKITDAPAMTEHLRDAALPAAPQPVTRRRFDQGGMREAADRCMNVGACRKSLSGVMCPSYMATRDEEHSTRGRANALVKALSSPDPRRALGEERLHQALDLCLECKACQRECPLGVDMAALKSEALAARHELHGVPLRSRLFASIRAVNRVGSAMAPVANAAVRLPGRKAAWRRLGLADARPVPRFAAENLVTWFRRRRQPAEAPAGEVIFLADSFTTFTEPQVGRAAVELLEMAGHRVRLASRGCCGRPAISKGMLATARRQAAAMVGRLAGPALSGAAIVGVEPSCLLTLRDEYPSLLGDSPAVRAVAGAARLADSLLADAVRDGRLACRGPEPVGRVVLHTHCHQRAIVGSRDTVELLRALPGAEVMELDAGCCGLAGSFGFEAEHYELSMRVGGLRLFPAVREQPPAATVVATGVSCRQQIAHGAGRAAVHPLELLRRHASAGAPAS